MRAIALREGWVTASIELDPIAADPAKPFSVYQELIAGLEFPMRRDGSRNEDFFDLIKEIRDNWMTVRSLKYLKASQWFGNGIEALHFLSHRRDEPHLDLAGQRSDGGVSAVDLRIRADGFDPVEVVGIGEIGRDDIAQCHPVALDCPVEVAETLQNDGGR